MPLYGFLFVTECKCYFAHNIFIKKSCQTPRLEVIHEPGVTLAITGAFTEMVLISFRRQAFFSLVTCWYLHYGFGDGGDGAIMRRGMGRTLRFLINSIRFEKHSPVNILRIRAYRKNSEFWDWGRQNPDRLLFLAETLEEALLSFFRFNIKPAASEKKNYLI